MAVSSHSQAMASPPLAVAVPGIHRGPSFSTLCLCLLPSPSWHLRLSASTSPAISTVSASTVLKLKSRGRLGLRCQAAEEPRPPAQGKPPLKEWRGIPTRLNNIPHSREIREYFYNDVVKATKLAIEDKKTRLQIDINIPELNPEMDVYRIGTLMELVRELSLSFADDGKRVKSLNTRSVFKDPWGKVHLLASHFNWQEPEKFWNSWTGVTTGQRAPSLILVQ